MRFEKITAALGTLNDTQSACGDEFHRGSDVFCAVLSGLSQDCISSC